MLLNWLRYSRLSFEMLVVVVLWMLCCVPIEAALNVQPEQVHLSYGATPSEMIITWVTQDVSRQPLVKYGKLRLTQFTRGNTTKFIDGGTENRKIYIHRVFLSDLIPDSFYIYHCGSVDGWSDLFSFRTMPEGTDWSPRLAVYGDLGNVNAQSLSRLQEETQNEFYDAILHVGDFAYDLDSDNARVGDAFMRQLEPIAAYVPYMVTVGNHEHAYNFSNYGKRFTMPSPDGNTNNLFYSWNIGPAHIISFSTEFYFYVEFGWTQIVEQYKWLKKDLEEANQPHVREKRPWIITLGHRPMYCTVNYTNECPGNGDILRKGIPTINAFGLEDLFYNNSVDLEIYAHEHNYERLWPVYDQKVYNGSFEEPYRNPKAPVHLITGSAGCKEKVDTFVKTQPWDAFRSSDYGYTRIKIINKTHLYLEQVSDDKAGAVIDSFTIIKDHHQRW